ncbi:MAG: hypothetical protein U9Q69_03840 [Nanoarchaeota archaeon]|nr:hypothetical protein [Nanoarchaeota archaeon]
MRNNQWLDKRMHQIWETLFPDVARLNEVIIIFKGKWKNKFGHIKFLKDKKSEIAINSLFQDEKIPEYIIDLTIAHELVHYYHGFNSPHKKKYKYPHKGGIVTRELKKRGFAHLLLKEKNYIKKEWYPFYKAYERKKNLGRFFLF